jgi:1-phosphofructokinase
VDRVVLTLGEKGAYLVTDEFQYGLRCPVADEALRNTVGAGDAFLAGWLAGCERAGGDLKEAFTWAVATGSASVKADTAVGYLRSAVEELRGQVQEI